MPDDPRQPHRLTGILLELPSPGALLTAAEQVRDAGYTRWDTHSPYPIHGIDEAMGIRRTRLPWVVFGLGVVGCLTGLALQWWTNAADPTRFGFVPTHFQGFDFLVSGKPIFSLPANIPVIFELTVLLAALGAVIGMLAMNNLPRHHYALFSVPRFRRVTNDRFYITIEAADPRFNPVGTEQFLASLGGLGVERVVEPPSRDKLPRGLVIGLTVLVCLAPLPPLLIAKARLSKSERPRVHIIQDMDNQERFGPQQAAPLVFADGRAARPAVSGTIARGDWPKDPHFHAGRVGDQWATTFPPQVEITEAFVRRGQQRFNIYCATCHGLGGAGDGIVSKRALELDTPGWVPPTSMHSEGVLEQPHGQIFNTITNGVRTMPPYGDQVPPTDRWAIVAYIRALQRSQKATMEDVPTEMRSELR